MLSRLATFPGTPGPVVIIVMDGYGLPSTDAGSAIAAARKPTLDACSPDIRTSALRAHGTAVGLPSDDDMGNSEVGHNAHRRRPGLRPGRAAGRTSAIATGAMFAGDGVAARSLPAHGADGSGCTSSACSPTATCTATSTTSMAMLQRGQGEGVQDGARPRRCSTAATCRRRSALDLRRAARGVARRAQRAAAVDCRIASRRRPDEHHDGPLRGRLERWSSAAGRRTCSASGAQFARRAEAVRDLLRRAIPAIIDQDLPPFVIAQDGKPVGADRGRRRRGVLQLPRRPRDRDHAARSRRTTSTSFDRVPRPERDSTPA